MELPPPVMGRDTELNDPADDKTVVVPAEVHPDGLVSKDVGAPIVLALVYMVNDVPSG